MQNLLRTEIYLFQHHRRFLPMSKDRGILCGTAMTTNNRENRENVMPLWEQYALTIEEAAIYFHIGENKLREIVAADPTQDFLLWNGNRCLIKRRLFEKFLDASPSV